VSFSESVCVCLGKYADFSGRAGRPEFWWFALFDVVVALVSTILDRVLGTGSVGGSGLIQAVTGLALLFPVLAVGARRLHDVGRSGWTQLLGLIPCIGVVLLIFWWADAGNGANRFGPALRDSGSSA
jgi:uncharacterized membrane protein YhaH (DUF805 family)